MVIFILFLLLFPSVVLSSTLSIELSTDTIEYGKRVSATITHYGKKFEKEINLSRWDDNFYIQRGDVETDTKPNGNTETTEKVLLYPRKTGELVLRKIAFSGAISQQHIIHVSPLVRDDINASPDWLPIPKTIWQNQTITTCILSPLLSDSNHIRFKDDNFTGFVSTKLNKKTIKNQRHQTVKQCWDLTANKNGALVIQSPLIEQTGNGRWQFYLTDITINVKPLPSYLPPYTPIGKVKIASSLIETDNIQKWEVSIVSSEHITLPAYELLTQLATIAKIDIDEIQSDTSHSNKQSYIVDVPDWTLPYLQKAIYLRYFDTEKNRLVTLSSVLPPTLSLPLYAKLIFGILFAAIIIATLYLLISWEKTRRKKKLLRQSISQATNIFEIRSILLKHNNCLTLTQWGYSGSYLSSSTIADDINRLCFSKHSQPTLVKIKKSLLS